MNGRPWTDRDVALLRELYPDTPTKDLVRRFGRKIQRVYAKAKQLGLRKSGAYLASPHACRLRRGDNVGAAFRYPKGHVPANKGMRRPGWFAGRMRETQFKKGHLPYNSHADFHVIGALRVNTDGYIDMRVSFELGAKGWRALHRILWEDRYGPVPKNHAVVFKNGDKLDCWYDNFELVSRAELMRRNTIHARYPQQLKLTVFALGQLKRRIREKQNRGSAKPPVRHAGGSA